MRKRLITPTPENIQIRGEGRLDVEHAAIVEITSENKEFPIEAAFVSGDARSWRAATPGNQTIRLIFDQPQMLRRISVVFEERVSQRNQEFILQADAAQSSLCAYLSWIALAGLLLNAVAHTACADPIAALGLLPFVIKEAKEAFEGHTCSCD